MASGKHLARRGTIAGQAAELFERQGYSQTSMDEIAATAGLAKGTLYHYFRTKDEILTEIHEQFLGLLLQRAQTREELGLPPSQQLLEVMTDVLELMRSHRGHVRVFFEHHRELSEAARTDVHRQRDAYEAMVRRQVELGLAQNEFRKIDPALTTLALFGMCNWAYQWYDVSGPLQPRDIALHFWSLLLRGIANPADDGRTDDRRP